VFEFEEAFQELEFRASERGHFPAMLGTAQHTQERDRRDFDQIVAGIFRLSDRERS